MHLDEVVSVRMMNNVSIESLTSYIMIFTHCVAAFYGVLSSSRMTKGPVLCEHVQDETCCETIRLTIVLSVFGSDRSNFTGTRMVYDTLWWDLVASARMTAQWRFSERRLTV